MITNRCEQDTNTQLLVLSEETDGLMYACRTAAITEGPSCMPSPFCLIKGVLLCPAKACRLCICTLSLRTLCVRMCYPARSISVRVTTSAVKESKRGGEKKLNLVFSFLWPPGATAPLAHHSSKSHAPGAAQSVPQGLRTTLYVIRGIFSFSVSAGVLAMAVLVCGALA